MQENIKIFKANINTITRKVRTLLSKIKVWSVDHAHLLFKSAAHNHLRIQECKQKPLAGETCSLSFESYSHLKRYQKKVRLITYSSSSTVLSVLVAMLVVQVFLPSLKSHGATFIFNQTSWSGGATGNSANHTGNQTLWNQYQAKDSNIAVVNGGADLQLSLPGVQSVQDESDAQFDGMQTGDGFYTDGSGKLYLKKPTTAACTLAVQCASGVCTGNVCQ